MLELCAHYGWAPDFWRTIGWRYLHLVIAQHNRRQRERADAARTDPGSWAGRDRDPFWALQDRLRGRG